MVFTHPLIFKSSSPCTNSLVTIPILLLLVVVIILESFSHQLTLMVFHCSLSDSKSPQVSRTLLSILAALNNPEVWVVSAHPLISKSSNPFINFFGNCTMSTNYNSYNRHFHVLQFLQFPSKVEVFIRLFNFFQFYSVVNWDNRDHNFASSLFVVVVVVDYYKNWSTGQD